MDASVEEAVKNSFVEFASKLTDTPDSEETAYWFHRELPANDFNREIVAPGAEGYPDGCLRIMCDDDFWEVARLPSEFISMPCREIVGVLWPEMIRPVIRPDHGDHWWTAIHDDTMEVPGQPFELWIHILRDGEVSESIRLNVYENEAETIEKGKKVEVGLDETSKAVWQIRNWSGGVRHDGSTLPIVASNALPRTP